MYTEHKSFASFFVSHWDNLGAKIGSSSDPVQVNGHNLDLASVIAIAKHGISVALDPNSIQTLNVSVETVKASLEKGRIFYGVNTGFGGSADTRPEAVQELQRELLRGLHYGVLQSPVLPAKTGSNQSRKSLVDLLKTTALPINHPTAATCMPETWVRASMLIRLNSLTSGFSGVRLPTVETLVQLIDKNIIPMVPIRGSISASGDLSPLSYIGGTMQGKPNLTVWTGERASDGSRSTASAKTALLEAGISPVIFGPKEGLAVVNGTAVSAGVAALALHEAHCLTALAQVLTAMTVEALHGTDESFDPFLAKVRPHFGQIESAQRIFGFLEDSKLVNRSDGSEESSLRQDRYSIRTASQWIGPVIEDMALAHEQIVTEINSVTDNPLIDSERDRILHGGNFQARAITSAVEKIRQSCQTIGRMLFVQCSELINPATSFGLPPNLVVDEPSESYIWKGTDILIAALQSELGFLANPVGSHVQTAEMGNQSLNSLALISSRYTLEALEVLSQLAAAHILALCQALDLRALHIQFLEVLRPEFDDITVTCLRTVITKQSDLDSLKESLWRSFSQQCDRTTNMDSNKRFISIMEGLQSLILKNAPCSLETLQSTQSWASQCSECALNLFHVTRSQYLRTPDASPFLGGAACIMYQFVRKHLQVPFFGEDHIRTPESEPICGAAADNDFNCHDYPTVGLFITIIYEAIRNGVLFDAVVQCFR